MTETTYSSRLQSQAKNFTPRSGGVLTGMTSWVCPSNIAIIKYWGKREVQLPMNPSLSITLQEAVTRTRLEYRYDPSLRDPGLVFRFGDDERRSGRQDDSSEAGGADSAVQGEGTRSATGKDDSAVPGEGTRSATGKDDSAGFGRRIQRYLAQVMPYVPWLQHTELFIHSENTFPHSSGIASSASAMGALALCLVAVEAAIGEPEPAVDLLSDPEVLQKASFLARLGSGSAARSLFPGLALWGWSDYRPGSSDEYAVPVTGFHNSFSDLRDAILIVESGRKKVSSSAGHALMENNPFAVPRFTQARENLGALLGILRDGDWQGFIRVLEEEALSLHAMMMTGRPGYLLMLPQTLSILHAVRNFREDTGCRIGFTLDAGANVHLIYPGIDAPRAEGFIRDGLTRFCEGGRVLYDRMGTGPALMS
jgi:diphosphomevalonate decarboxylase